MLFLTALIKYHDNSGLSHPSTLQLRVGPGSGFTPNL